MDGVDGWMDGMEWDGMEVQENMAMNPLASVSPLRAQKKPVAAVCLLGKNTS